jgi:SGNH hydrolase-like domain, acetyltransferase AlgX
MADRVPTAMMRRLWLLVPDWLLIVTVTLAGLAVLEVVLTVSFPGDRLGRRPIPDRLVPNRTETFELSPANGGRTVAWRSNRWGFRGPDVDLATDLPRIMVYGDSNILARFSVLEATFVHQLADRLFRKTGRLHDVINAGKIGFGPDEIALRIAADMDLWKPDLVIVNLFADNDFGDLFRNNLIRLDADGAPRFVTEGASVSARLAMFLQTLSIYRASALLSNALFGQAERMRRTGRLPGEEELDYLRRRVDEEYRNYLGDLRTGGPDHYDLDVALDPAASSSQLKIKLMAAVLARITKLVHDDEGRELLFIVQPSSYDISTNMPLNYTILRDLSPSYDRRNLTSTIEQVLDELGVWYISLFDRMLAVGTSDHYFMTDDNHWNDQGQALAAETVAEAIQTRLASAETAPPSTPAAIVAAPPP